MKVVVLALFWAVSAFQVAAFALSAAHPGWNEETTYYDLYSGPTCFSSHALSSSLGGHRIAIAGAKGGASNCGGHDLSADRARCASTSFSAEYIGTPCCLPRSFVKIRYVAIFPTYRLARTPSRSTSENIERSANA